MWKIVSPDNYRKLLTEMFIPELENRKHMKKAISQQDGVKPQGGYTYAAFGKYFANYKLCAAELSS